jgi:hypothetical protein
MPRKMIMAGKAKGPFFLHDFLWFLSVQLERFAMQYIFVLAWEGIASL